jgi:hypothetical protein
MGKNRGGAGPVADRVAGLLRRFADHMGAQVFFGIFKIDFLGDSHPVVADDRTTPFLVDQDALGFWAERDANRVGQCGGALEDFLPRGRPKKKVFVRHGNLLVLCKVLTHGL